MISNYGRELFMIFFFYLLLLFMASPSKLLASENTETYNIEGILQIVWVNDSEMLIVDKSGKWNVLKFNITLGNFTKIVNHEHYENIDQIRISKDGKLFGLLKKGKVYLYENKKVVFEHDLKIPEKYKKKLGAVELRILDITDKHVIINSSRYDNESPYHIPESPWLYMYFLNYRNPSDSHYSMININLHPIGSIFSKNDGTIVLGKDPSEQIYLYSIEKNEIDRSLYLNNMLRLYSALCYGDNIYFTATFDNLYKSPINSVEESMLKKKTIRSQFESNLFVYKYENYEGRTKEYIRDVNWFDVSNRYLATTTSLEVESKKPKGEYLAEVQVYDNLDNVSHRYLWKISNDNEYPCQVEIIPAISPDEKKLVIFQTYTNEKPIIIELK